MHMVVLQTGSSAAFCSSLLFTWTNQLSDGRFDNHGGKGELVSGSFLRIDVFPRKCIESNTAISRKKWQFVEIKETKLKYRLNSFYSLCRDIFSLVIRSLYIPFRKEVRNVIWLARCLLVLVRLVFKENNGKWKCIQSPENRWFTRIIFKISIRSYRDSFRLFYLWCIF